MITYVVGELFESSASVLVNPVNTVGVMGAGVSADFKRIYPAMFEGYAALCAAGQFTSGSLWLYKTAHKWVLNFPVKEHYRARAQPAMIEAGLQKFATIYAAQSITSLALPMLGTGDGGLRWEEDVRPLLEAYLNPLPIAVYVYRHDVHNPFATESSARAVRARLEGLPRTLDFATFWRDLNRTLKKTDTFKLPETGERFRVGIDPTRKSIVLLTGAPQPVFLSQSLLGDLWAYVRSAGYVLPQNLPGGLDEAAAYVIALLSVLPYLRPVYLGRVDGEWLPGLQYLPPTERKPPQQVGTMQTDAAPAKTAAPTLPDVLAPGLRVVFCGTAAGDASAAAGAYYAGPGNRFWETLYTSGLTPRRFAPAEFRELAALGIGLTDLAKQTSGADSTLRSEDFDADGLRERIRQHAPQVVAFTSKRAAEVALRRPVDYGWQGEDFGGAKVFVLPSPSGAARGFWDESYWQQLGAYVRRLTEQT